MTKRKEVPVRNHPGIYKQLRLDASSPDPKWVETGRYRAIRRVKGPDGRSRKEQQMFDHLEMAKAFRYGGANAGQVAKPVLSSEPRMSFEELVKEWQPFHYLKPGAKHPTDLHQAPSRFGLSQVLRRGRHQNLVG